MSKCLRDTKGIIGMLNYVATEKFAKRVNWQKISSSSYITKKRFRSVAQRLVRRKLLSDDGKSMAALCLDRLGVAYVVGMIENEPGRMSEISSRMG